MAIPNPNPDRAQAEHEASHAHHQLALNSPTARVKVVDPLMTIGPSTPARILGFSENGLSLEMPRDVLPGSLVHIRTGDKMFYGRVQCCVPLGAAFEIAVQIVENF